MYRKEEKPRYRELQGNRTEICSESYTASHCVRLLASVLFHRSLQNLLVVSTNLEKKKLSHTPTAISNVLKQVNTAFVNVSRDLSIPFAQSVKQE